MVFPHHWSLNWCQGLMADKDKLKLKRSRLGTGKLALRRWDIADMAMVWYAWIRLIALLYWHRWRTCSTHPDVWSPYWMLRNGDVSKPKCGDPQWLQDMSTSQRRNSLTWRTVSRMAFLDMWKMWKSVTLDQMDGGKEVSFTQDQGCWLIRQKCCHVDDQTITVPKMPCLVAFQILMWFLHV